MSEAERRLEKAEREAANWIALQDGCDLTPVQQREFDAWLAADPRHAAVVAELGAAWRTFDGLRHYPRPAFTSDPDFFARPRRFRRAALLVAAAAAAAAIAIGGILWLHVPEPKIIRQFASENATRLVHLPDGTLVDLNAGSEIVERFTGPERRVLLLRGEGSFMVAKNPARPFIVNAHGVNVRAVGTVFNVRLNSDAVEVLVTEGRVQVAREPAAAARAPASLSGGSAIPLMTAGQFTVVGVARGAAPPVPTVATLSPEAIQNALSWRTNKLIFEATPLAEVVGRFNRKSAHRLIVTDSGLAGLRISGQFRTDDVDSFVKLLEASFGVVVERQPDGTIELRREGGND